MIKFRYSVFEATDKDTSLEILAGGENLATLMVRALEGTELGDFSIEDIYQVTVNGMKIEPEFWFATHIKETDAVIISPLIKGGDQGGVLRTFIQIAVVVAAAYFTAGLSAPLVAAISISATIVTGLILNALIPPPNLDLDAGSLESSQMYSVTSQSNTTKKLGTVPKVYGTHRMFPVVAANPYTELELDPGTGELAQYLYAIYDFGLGPSVISDIRIGESHISQFEDVSYTFIDFNKPAVSEGPWDDQLITELTWYKGDREVDGVAVTLPGNQSAGGPSDTWQATRTAAEDTDGSKQEITLNFLNPEGLVGYSSTGAASTRSINLDVRFAKVGTNDWKGYNDTSVVEGFSSLGGDLQTFVTPLTIFPCSFYGTAPYTLLYEIGGDRRTRYVSTPYPFPQDYQTRPYTRRSWGIPAGSTYIVVQNVSSQFPLVGSPVTFKGTYVGRIASTSVYDSGHTRLNLEAPIPNMIRLFEYGGYVDQKNWFGQPMPDLLETIDGTVSGLFSANTPSLGKAKIVRESSAAVYSTIKFRPRQPGQYKVRVIRESSTSAYTTQVRDTLTWVSLVTRFDRVPIITDKRHTFMEIKIRATNQLNGAIQNLSGVVTSVLDTWDGTTWTKKPTNNPAWAVVDLLTGPVNKRAIPKSRLDLPSILEWAEYCDEVPPLAPAPRVYAYPRFQCNFVLDYAATLQSVIGQIAGSAQASLNIIGGKYGILLDVMKTVPVQVFTIRNSRDFTSSRNYSPRPHALRVKFIDPERAWDMSEVAAYDNDYSIANATEFEDITAFGCTNEEQAYRFGRYMIAQNRLRQETMSLSVDFEHLVCSRGDFVQIAQDVMRVGGSPARVKTVVGNLITIDDGLDLSGGVDYGYVFRGSDGVIATDTLTVMSASSFELDGELPSPGDLIVIGEVTKIVYDCIVKSISPNDDMSASITLVEKADGIFSYESSGSFPEYLPNLSSTTDSETTPPGPVDGLLIVDSGHECDGAGYLYFAQLSWDTPAGSAYEYFQVFANYGQGATEVGSTRSTLFTYIVDQDFIDREHVFTVLAVSATGKKISIHAAPSVSYTPEKKSTPPSDVERLDIDITGEVLQLVWSQIPDCDSKEYLIRFSPTDEGTWESSVPLLRVDRNTTLSSTQARTGTYLIKAVDYNNNESVHAARAITTIPNLFNLNMIQEFSDAPDWEGGKDKVVKVGDTLILQTEVDGGANELVFFSEGYYYCKELLDLGEVYTVRLQSLIEATGYTLGDFMSEWMSLADVEALSSARGSDWDVEAQYRSTTSLNTMDQWTTLSDVESLAAGEDGTFTEWRKFIMGDATGRWFQFRFKLISNKTSVSPRLISGLIRADMPDRVDSFNNMVSDAVAGYTLTYSPAFKGPGTTPNVQVSIDDAESGDYWAFDYKTLEGFKIRFYDKDNTQVARQFDVAVKGFGRKSTGAI